MRTKRWFAATLAAAWLTALTIDVPIATAQRGGRSYSSGSRSSSSGSRSSSSSRPSSSSSRPSSSSSRPSSSRPTTNTGRSGWKSGPARTSNTSDNRVFPTGKSGWSPPASSPSRKPSSSFDTSAGRAQRRDESKANYQKSNPSRVPAPPTANPVDRTPRSADPRTWQTDPRDRQIDELKRQLDRERYSNWDRRQRDFFGGYWGRPVVVYRDPYSSFFWWWLLDQSLDTRARWAYSHRHAMDDQRYRDLLAKDAQLEAKIKELEAQKVPRDPSWTPTGIENDLVYKKEYVEEANKRPAPTAPDPTAIPGPSFPETNSLPGSAPTDVGTNGSGWTAFFVTVAMVAFLIWLVFFKRWGG